MSFGFSIGDFIAVAQLVNGVRQNFANAPHEYSAIYNETKSLSNVIRDLDDVLPSAQLSDQQQLDLAHAKDSCDAVLQDLNKIITQYSDLEASNKPTGFRDRSRRIWKRVKLPPDDVRAVRSRLTSTVTLLGTLRDGIINTKIYEIGHTVERIGQSQDSQERDTIENWFAPPTFATQQSDFAAKRQPGTGAWLLDHAEYKEWKKGNVPTLVCPGIPGAGKTMMVCGVVEDLWNQYGTLADVAVTYLYLNFKRQHEQKLSDLLAALVRQLFQEKYVLPKEVRDLYDQHKFKTTRPSAAELSRLLQSLATMHDRVFIVIDALDECTTEDQTVSRLISYVAELHALPTVNLSLLVTSRFIPAILSLFTSGKQLEIQASNEDVERYLDGQMPRLASCVNKRLDLQAEIRTEIINSVKGMFLLAALHMDSLADKTKPKDIRAALKNLPKGSESLDIAYSDAILRIESQQPGHRSLATKVLSWITFSLRPLTIDELRHAVAIEPGMTQLDPDEDLDELSEIISCCAGLVVSDSGSNTIRLVHYTTQEFLESGRVTWLSAATEYLARSCVHYMMLDPRLTQVTLDDWLAQLQQQARFGDERGTMLSNVLTASPFLAYASRHWGDHVTQSKSIETLNLALSFLMSKNNFLLAIAILLYQDLHFLLRTIESVSPMHLFACYGWDQIAAASLAAGLKPDIADSRGETPLMWAVTRNKVAMVKMLLNCSEVNINAHDKFGDMPILLAAENNSRQVVELLLARDDLTFSVKDSGGKTPLFLAAEYNSLDVVELLLAKDGAAADTEDRYGRKPLHAAAMRDNPDVVKLLIAHDQTYINTPDCDGETPISYAADSGSAKTVEYLLTRDGISLAPDHFGRTPLSYAARSSDVDTVKLLVAHDHAAINTRDIHGRTPLSYAAESYKGADIVEYLLTLDGISLAADYIGRIPLSYAVTSWGWGGLETAKLLVAYDKASINTRDIKGRTPLSHAAESYKGADIVEYLLTLDGISLSGDDQGLTHYDYATQKGNTKIQALLLAEVQRRQEAKVKAV